ncbi:integral membrane protein [Staphylotrichum tortipilum]|uniref:Integral membrane protein n=1 Tax=Staphylotrichum tortipilum TaxID=2831512 RepID=A0AAN6MNR3_9PEZI|nr:integral membrane protein [Staphylotrichum longicolle]
MAPMLHSEDYFSLVALICGYISTAMSTVAVVSFGNGKHTALLSTEQQEGAIFWTTIAFCPGVLSVCLPKLAVVVLLIRILLPGSFHKCFLWTMVILCQLSFIVAISILLGRCRPTRSIWDFSVQGTCINIDILVNYGLAVTAYSAFVDFYLAVYPSVILFRIQMLLRKELAPAVPRGISATWKKVALGVALGIGANSGVVAIYKATKVASLGSPDFSHDTADLVIWTV